MPPMPSIGQVMSSLFGNNSGATAQPPKNPNQQPQNQREQQQQQGQSQQQKPTGQTPSGEQSVLEGAGSGEAAGNPLDKFKDIWQPPTGADGKPIQRTKQKAIPNLDPGKIMEFASKQDFKKFVKPETLAAIAKGGDEASAAFAQAMQDIGSSTFASAITASGQMMQAALDRQAEQFESGMNERFTRFSLRENLSNKNPVLKHPAAKPIVEALQATLANKYPDASAAELQSTAEEFLTAFTSSLSGKEDDGETGGKGGKKEPQADWSKFLPDYMQGNG